VPECRLPAEASSRWPGRRLEALLAAARERQGIDVSSRTARTGDQFGDVAAPWIAGVLLPSALAEELAELALRLRYQDRARVSEAPVRDVARRRALNGIVSSGSPQCGPGVARRAGS
jgi:hypothetical protein